VWIQIHGQVYDVTPWLRDHPGGSEVLMDGAQNGKVGGAFRPCS
jgi:cytochrome b involved in lipid metabolism